MKNKTIKGANFYGNPISKYGLENGYVDYAALTKSFDAVLCNDFPSWASQNGYLEPYHGNEFYEDEDGEKYVKEVFQWYIISKQGAEILEYWTDEIIYYYEPLDIYIWGITHFGTSWDYVLTDIKIEKEV